MVAITQTRVSGSVTRLHPDNNVVVACRDRGRGECVPSEKIVRRSQISAGYKMFVPWQIGIMS